MDPILYFLTHSFLLHLTLAVVACAVGLLVAWWLWGPYALQARNLGLELSQLKERFAKGSLERDGFQRQLDEQRTARQSAEADAARLGEQVGAQQVELEESRRYSNRLESEITTLRERNATLSQGREELIQTREELQNQLTRLAAELSQSEARSKDARESIPDPSDAELKSAPKSATRPQSSASQESGPAQIDLLGPDSL